MKTDRKKHPSLFDDFKDHMNKAFGAIHNCDLDTGETELEKMQAIVEKSSHPDDHGLLCIAKFKLEDGKRRFDKAIEWLEKAREFFNQSGSINRLMIVYFEAASAYFRQGEYKLAIENFNLAIDCADKTNDIENKANIMNNLGECYIFMNQNLLALDYTMKALAIREELKQKQKIGLSLTNVTRIYNNLAEYDKSLEYGLKALEILKNSPGLAVYANALNTVGITYYCLENYDQALEYLYQSLELKEKQRNPIRISNTLNSIANVYMKQGQLEEAKKLHTEALKIRQANNALELISRSKLRLADIAYRMGDTNQAEKLCLEAASHLKENNQLLLELYDLLASIYQATEAYPKACHYHNEYRKLFKTVAEQTNDHRLAEMRTRFKLEQKDRETELLIEKNHELEEKNKMILSQKERLDETLDELRRSERNLDFLTEEIKSSFETRIIGRSEAMQNILRLMSKVAQADDTSVLIMGESGTGKELVARGIHEMSRRKSKYFHAINSSAISSSLFESEFFGYEKGAFTGALDRKAGWFEVTDGGTLFLDEIGNMPLDHQIKLLRVLEERNIIRVGARHEIPVNVRVISATNLNLLDLVDNKTFREDLYHRLAAFVINIPPLRERSEDIQPLVEHFVNLYTTRMNKPIRRIDPGIYNALSCYAFPGNIRELRNMVERALIICDSSTLQFKHFSIPANGKQKSPDIPDDIIPIDTLERTMLLRALRRTGNNQTQAAKLLGLSQKAVERRINKFDLRKELEPSQ